MSKQVPCRAKAGAGIFEMILYRFLPVTLNIPNRPCRRSVCQGAGDAICSRLGSRPWYPRRLCLAGSRCAVVTICLSVSLTGRSRSVECVVSCLVYA